MPLALLLRERSEDYAREAARAGWEPLWLPALRFGPANGDALGRALADGRHSGLVLTSPRAAEACAPYAPLRLRTFAVGGATAGAAERLLGVAAEGRSSGDAASLAAHVASAHDRGDPRPLLFPCGDLAGSAIETRLRAEGIAVERLVVYETRARPELAAELGALAAAGRSPDAVGFFSPSGVDAAWPTLVGLGWDAKAILAVGPTTAARLAELGARPLVAVEPTAEAMASLLGPPSPL